MHSVVERSKTINQPWGGYVRPRLFNATKLNDPIVLFPSYKQSPIQQHDSQENIGRGIVGMAVDYLSRFAFGDPVEEAFFISLYAAEHIGEIKNATLLASRINGLDDNSIVAACKLAGYDVVYRAGSAHFVPVELINPNRATIYNVREMVGRITRYFDDHGPVTSTGLSFEGGYTHMVSKGDGDFATADTLWDLKTSTTTPTKEHTLQLCMYWLMGLHSYHSEFYKAIDNLGIFNPRLGMVYTLPIADIPRETLYTIETEVICYEPDEAFY